MKQKAYEKQIIKRGKDLMINIGLHQFKNSFSSYIEVLKEKEYTLVSLEKETGSEKRTKLEAIILDFTEEATGEAVGQICELLFRVKNSDMPFIFVLLQESTPVERLIYLQLGATIVFDHYTKPNEFAVIVSNLLQQKVKLEQPMVQGEEIEERIQLNDYNHSLYIENEREVFLTPLEYKLVGYLKGKQEQGATYEEIYQVLWGKEMGNKQYRVANLVFHIRNKIETNAANPEYLKTIRTIGYLLCT